MPIAVLIADDHAIVRDGLKRIVDEQLDMKTVGFVGNGRDCVAKVAKRKPDVVVMDITMPVMNGIEAAARLKETWPDLPILFLSMHGDVEYVHRAMESGAAGYILKEAAASELVEAIRTVNSGRQFLGRKVSEMLAQDALLRRGTPRPKNPLELLSRREREIVQLVVEGRSNTEIAGIVNLSSKTVDTYRSRAMHKLGLSNVAALIKMAIRYGLVAPD